MKREDGPNEAITGGDRIKSGTDRDMMSDFSAW
jgi:hypothetical protein